MYALVYVLVDALGEGFNLKPLFFEITDAVVEVILVAAQLQNDYAFPFGEYPGFEDIEDQIMGFHKLTDDGPINILCSVMNDNLPGYSLFFLHALSPALFSLKDVYEKGRLLSRLSFYTPIAYSFSVSPFLFPGASGEGGNISKKGLKGLMAE
jgi:hypothetical protein